MPPVSSQKGTGKKGGAGAMRQQPRSRNTTPSAVAPVASLPPIEVSELETLDLRCELFRNITFEDLVDPNASSALIPDSKALDGIVSRLKRLGEIIDKRESFCDKGMRLLSAKRKTRMDEMAAERGQEDERRQREAEEEERERKATKKKRKATESLMPQSQNTERSSPLREASSGKPRKRAQDNESTSSSLSPVAPGTPTNMDVDDKTKAEDDDEDESSDEDDGRPPPPARPQANTYGDDPSTFPDPTVYEILPVQPGMAEDEIKEIYSVETYPKNDLSDLIAGDPPDKDFSNAKPSNQINFSTFSTYIEPYFRSFTEEDLAFLRERGDRVNPFIIPRRGKRHYTEIWAEADGAMAVDSPQGRDKLPPNQPRGNIENMDDDVGETDKLSVGPLLTRLLSALRVEHRAPPADAAANGVNGDTDTVMGGVPSFDLSFGDGTAPSQPQLGLDPTAVNGATTNGNGSAPGAEQSLPPATCIPESSSEAWKKASHPKLDYAQVDERLRQELRHIGFMYSPPNDNSSSGGAGASSSGGGGGNAAGNSSGGGGSSSVADPSMTADYDGHYDDEVAARLRLLQSRLREQALVNGARKARLAELVKERMAYQEYQTILEDLDSQVQAAYLKRTRTMGKKPKKARPGAAAASSLAAGGVPPGTARPGIGDMTRTLMERRRRWIENIGTVFDGENLVKVPRATDEGSTIFKPEEMAGLIKKEKEAWDEEVDEE